MSSMDAEYLHWVRTEMPVLIEFATTPTDQWLRDAIRGTAGIEPPPLHRVIVQGTTEAERVVNRLANLKHAHHQPYGGAMHRRIEWPEIRTLLRGRPNPMKSTTS